MHQSAAQSGPADTPRNLRRLVVFGIAALSLLLISMNITVAIVAVPEIVAGLNTSIIWVGWVLTGYMLAHSVVMPAAGGLAERFGRKRLFVLAIAVFIVGSVGAGLAWHIVPLILFRILMAIGGGAFLPAAAGIVGDLFPERRAQMIGLFSSIFPIGTIIGPTFGGFLVDQFSWRWAFLMNVPVAVFAFVLAVVLLTEERSETKHDLDVPGLFYMGSGILSFMLGLTLLGEDYGISPAIIVVLFALSAALLVLFWRQEQRAVQPILDLTLVRMRPLFASNTFNFILGLFAIGLFSFLPLYAVTVYGLTTFQSGAVLSGRGLGMILSSSLTSMLLLGRVSYRVLMVVGVLLTALSFIPLGFTFTGVTLVGVTISEFWLLMGILTLSGIGMGVVNPPANNAGIELLPSKVASITGLRGTFRSIGGLVTTTFIFFLLAITPDEGVTLRMVCLAFGLLFPLAIILVMMMPTGRESSLERAPEKAGPGSD